MPEFRKIETLISVSRNYNSFIVYANMNVRDLALEEAPKEEVHEFNVVNPLLFETDEDGRLLDLKNGSTSNIKRPTKLSSKLRLTGRQELGMLNHSDDFVEDVGSPPSSPLIRLSKAISKRMFRSNSKESIDQEEEKAEVYDNYPVLPWDDSMLNEFSIPSPVRESPAVSISIEEVNIKGVNEEQPKLDDTPIETDNKLPEFEKQSIKRDVSSDSSKTVHSSSSPETRNGFVKKIATYHFWSKSPSSPKTSPKSPTVAKSIERENSKDKVISKHCELSKRDRGNSSNKTFEKKVSKDKVLEKSESSKEKPVISETRGSGEKFISSSERLLQKIGSKEKILERGSSQDSIFERGSSNSHIFERFNSREKLLSFMQKRILTNDMARLLEVICNAQSRGDLIVDLLPIKGNFIVKIRFIAVVEEYLNEKNVKVQEGKGKNIIETFLLDDSLFKLPVPARLAKLLQSHSLPVLQELRNIYLGELLEVETVANFLSERK